MSISYRHRKVSLVLVIKVRHTMSHLNSPMIDWIKALILNRLKEAKMVALALVFLILFLTKNPRVYWWRRRRRRGGVRDVQEREGVP